MNKEKILYLAKKSLRFLPDKMYVKLYFRLRLGRKLDMHNPVTLNEKLQWMKFNYRFPLQTIVSDKLLVRSFVARKVGNEYLIPLLGKWDSFDDIDFSKLPNKFVLKCNHDSGGLVICKDKDSFNVSKARKIINASLSTNFYYIGREYQYRNIVPKIICEQFISDGDNIPIDYKIYCFNGQPDAILVCKDRFSNESHKAKYYFYNQEWKFLPLNKGDDISGDPKIEKPKNFETMIKIASVLSSEFYFARIDLYNISGKIYFGEITLCPNSGFDADITYSTDLAFGRKLFIPLLGDSTDNMSDEIFK